MRLDTSASASSAAYSCILLNSDPDIGSRRNNTTAVGQGRDNLTIEASFCYAQPPLPSNLFVHCPGATFPRSSIIVSTADDLLLFRVPVAVEPPPKFIRYDDCDYIIYRAGRSPSLTRIPNPKPNFYDLNVGLLSRAGDLFTVAALVANSTNEFTLHRFDSEVGNWSMKTVLLDAPRKPYPMRIPANALRLNHHITTTVITLGGKSGTMGWVDLWSGILLYDLFPEEDQERPPMLWHMRLPLPMDLGKWVTVLGCPKSTRGIASVIKDGKPCLKLAGLQIIEERLPYDDIETYMPCYRVNNWAITTWSNTIMVHANSSDNWQEDFTVWAPDIIISDTVRSELLASGLLHRKPSQDGEETVELALQNLVVSEPTPSLNGEEEVVYLMARPKYFHPKAWALAIDIKNHTLLDVAEFGTAKAGMLPIVTYRSSAISKYLTQATPPVTRKT
ncbi:uncharacterized protein LOC102705368 isoform X3 [Oryza brachyantha]|uniref:uncharacterized protein LOC102705368 isoform X3 n=1 Tax=Oryza brachyantha TaxID=4533 RepID=UPI001ADB6B81|nr:uncharacterized protein LOC102705368 isoform X3 [Oryza brachyantha]